MSKKAKKAQPPLSREGWISIVTAGVFAIAVMSAIAIALIPIDPAATLGERVAKKIAAIGPQLHAPDGRGIMIPLFMLAIAGGVMAISSARARRRPAPIGTGRAIAFGVVDSILGLAFEAFDVGTSGGGRDDRSSSSGGGGMSGGGGSFGGGGSSGTW